MAQIITVEMPWLDSYQATLLHNLVDTELDIQTAMRRSPLPGGVKPEYPGIPHQAILSALLSANEGLLKSKLYETEVDTLGPNSFRLNWYSPKANFRGPMETVMKALKHDNAVELQYLTDVSSHKAVKPLKIFEWGFRGATYEGPRNYRWDRIFYSVEVPKQLPGYLMEMEIKVKGFGLRKRFSTKLLKTGYRAGERISKAIDAYDFVTG